MDGYGYIYVSCWGTNAVYRYDNEFSLPAELVSSGNSGPADIFYNQQNNILAIPNYYSNSVDFVTTTPVDVDELYGQIPLTVAMSQNYPNPFNPTTKIRYSIPQSSKVLIKIFDVLSNEIETLVNEEKQAGTYEINWYAEGLPSGVYFYRLQAGSFVETKKMLLMK
jgi:hypothetical protein